MHKAAYDKRNKGLCITVLRYLLSLLSFVYWLWVMSIKFLCEAGVLAPQKLDCVVISVGNITWGGTGKTPLVEMLAKSLTSEGKKVAVLLRGYGKKVPWFPCFAKNLSPSVEWMETGDEAALLKKNLPGIHVLVGRDRLKNGRLAINKYGIDTLILDDGYQHWQIDRDFNIVTINGNNPFGNGWLLPRGILREPVSSISRADVVCLTKVDGMDTGELQAKLKGINCNLSFVESIHNPVYLYDFYEKKRLGFENIKETQVIIFSGIGDPDSFKENLIKLGARVEGDFRYPDHYIYRNRDIEDIFTAAGESGIDTVITTEKDMVRVGPLLDEFRSLESRPNRILSLRIELKIITNERGLIDRLLAVYMC